MNENLLQRLNEISFIDDSWKPNENFEKDNKEWLSRTAIIATKLLIKLRENKLVDRFPSNKENLSKFLNFSQVKLDIILKGQYELTIKDLYQIEKFLEIKIINL